MFPAASSTSRRRGLPALVNRLPPRNPGCAHSDALLAANALRIGDHKFSYLLKVMAGARQVP